MGIPPATTLFGRGPAAVMSCAAIPAGALLSAAAQVLLKRASACPVLSGAWVVFFLLSAAFYGLSMLVYMFLLRIYPMSTIYPVITLLVIALVNVYAALTGEQLTARRTGGLACGALAIVLLLA